MNKKLLTLIVAISILMSIGTAVATPPSPVSSPVYWTGQGTDSDVDCSDENFKGAPGIHWIATGYNTATTNYNLTINVSGVDEDPVTPYNITGNAIHFYTKYYDFDTLGATLTFDGTMDHNAKVVISHYCPPVDEIPEFPTIALPVLAILGLSFIFMRRKE